jgi:hypothetical protein
MARITRIMAVILRSASSAGAERDKLTLKLGLFLNKFLLNIELIIEYPQFLGKRNEYIRGSGNSLSGKRDLRISWRGAEKTKSQYGFL